MLPYHTDPCYRLNKASKDSFTFQMEILHPMQNPKQEARRLPVTVSREVLAPRFCNGMEAVSLSTLRSRGDALELRVREGDW